MTDAVAIMTELPRPRGSIRRSARAAVRGVGSAVSWMFGLGVLVVGLAALATVPVVQFLSLGYLLESSSRVARSGRLRDGLVGVRLAGRIGLLAIGVGLSTVPLLLLVPYARAAELIDPGGPTSVGWSRARSALAVLTILHVGLACARGGRLGTFLWPIGHLGWIVSRVRAGDVVAELRGGLPRLVAGLRLPHYFRLGLVGYAGTSLWLAIPAALLAVGGRAPAFGIVGALAMAIVVPYLPFAQVLYAVEGRFSAFYTLGPIRDRARRAPWAFAFALVVLLAAAIPPYLLAAEPVPRGANWLPALGFVALLGPARLAVGWAYWRSGRRELPRGRASRAIGRLVALPASAFYVLVVVLAQYVVWGGTSTLIEQHAFLLPAPNPGL